MRTVALMTLVGCVMLGLNCAAVSKTDMTIRLSGWLDVAATAGVTRSFFEVTATPMEISATLRRRVLGTREPEATDIEAEFKISDTDFVSSWRSSASLAFANSPVHRGRVAETRLPNGYWLIFPEQLADELPTLAADHSSERIDSSELVRATLAQLNGMLDRKEYRDLKVYRSEGDGVPAVVVDVKNLLAAPNKWDGKRIRITGWASVGEEERQLFPSRLTAWLGKRGIWIGEESAIANGSPAVQPLKEGPRELEGIVRAYEHGHLSGISVCTIDRLTINRTL